MSEERRWVRWLKTLPIPTSYLWAILFTALIAVWFATGDIKGGSSIKGVSQNITIEKDAVQNGQATGLFRVRTAAFQSQIRPAKLIIRGRTFSDKQVLIRAETAGLVEKLPVEKGDFVEKGTALCIIESGAREASLIEARAALAQAEADYDAAQKLVKRGHVAELKVMQNRAQRDAARAALKRIELDVRRTKITAPFSGYVEELPSKVGSFLNVGGHCATLVSLDPLLVVGAVRENDIGKLKPGMNANALLVTGHKVSGKINFIAANAEENTRTFKIEIEIDNPDGDLKSGVTADIIILLEPQNAMLLPPNILTLNDKGQVGVRMVGSDKHVIFQPVKILSEESDGIWIEALEGADIITVGQDFVKPGQKVIPVADPNFSGRPGS